MGHDGSKLCSCGVRIRFIKSSHKKFIPVEMGTVAIVTKEGRVVNGPIVHFGRCKNVDQYRKLKKEEQ